MNKHLRWLTPAKTILILQVPEYWTWNEFKRWLSDIESILNTGTIPVAVVVDFQYATHVPRNAVQHSQRILQNLHPMADPIILAGISAGHRAVLDLLLHLFPTNSQRLIIVDHVDDVLINTSG